MPTPKSLRAAPNNTFENYILTFAVDSSGGLTNVAQERFSQVSGSAGQGGSTGSSILDIGFGFSFDNRIHTKIVVSSYGFAVLAAPGEEDMTTIINDVVTQAYDNTSIKDSFSSQNVLCAVWYDFIRNGYETVNGLSLTRQQIDLYDKGLLQPDRRLNPRNYGVQYCNDNNSPEGRRLIIRWNSLSGYGGLSPSNAIRSILRFELVLYENGKIEYRYSPRENLITAASLVGNNEDATIGIFMPEGTWRFRDFSYELGYQQTLRERYKFGGTTSGSYTETIDGTTVPYSAGLTPESNWPGRRTGAIFTFQPPLNRRKVLPRLSLKEKDSRITLPTVARTGDHDRPGNANISFDDRRSIVYGQSTLINYPTTLPRFYASMLSDVTRNQDLFLEDFVLTGSVIPSNVQDYLTNNEKNYITPFSEYKLFENDASSSTDDFFLVGTKVVDVGQGFSQPLKSKTQIRLSFRVDHKTVLFGASSSIYYFNDKTGRWQYPTSSFNNGQFDIANPYGDANSDRLIEVDRCFNAFGFNLVSGSSDRTSQYAGTDELINSPWTSTNEINALIKSYAKSVQTDERYSAINDESFLVPIQQPFLLEKAVIELPIEAGPGWFNDKTRCFIPLTEYSPGTYDSPSNTFDIGGPGITVSLFNQVSVGRRKNKRDLILSGTFTHELDNIAELSYSSSPDILAGPGNENGKIWQLTPIGFRAYSTPSTVINSSSLVSPIGIPIPGFYTGSVKIKCEAAVTNGILVKDAFYITNAYNTVPEPSVENAHLALEALLNRPSWTYFSSSLSPQQFITGSNLRERKIISISSFGRNNGGFNSISGRSIFGKEYATFSKSGYDNPFYLYKNDSTLQDLKNIISSVGGLDKTLYASSVIQKAKTSVSPYLLFPGDRLILAVSKSRPVFFNGVDTGAFAPVPATPPYTSGSLQHDIKLTTGSINITLYGSLVANGQEFHDTLNQPLASDAIHEVVIGETKIW